MTWWCAEYGKNVLGVSYIHDDCEKCHMKDKCVRESIKEDTELLSDRGFQEGWINGDKQIIELEETNLSSEQSKIQGEET